MNRVYTLPEANRVLRLVRAIAAEFVERRTERRRLDRERYELEHAATPEGLSQELAALDARIWEHDEMLFSCRREIESLGMTVLQTNPLTIHIPGHSRSGPVTFCWEEGEDSVCFGHPVGEELDQRRPLRLKAI
jgi:hypothetical protein